MYIYIYIKHRCVYTSRDRLWWLYSLWSFYDIMYSNISNSHDYLTYSQSVIQLLLPPKRESRNHHLENIWNHHLTTQLNLVQTHLPGAAPASLTVSPLHLSETQREAPRKVTQVGSEYVCGKRTSCRLICIFKFHETYEYIDMTWISPRLWGIHWKRFWRFS